MRRIISRVILAVILLSVPFFAGSCGKPCGLGEKIVYRKGEIKMDVTKEIFGTMPDGREVELYTLVNANGVRARIMNYGAILVSLEVPDKNGNLEDVTLGYYNFEDYLKNNSPYFGAIVGRYGNRVGDAQFTLDGVTYNLAANNGKNHLHGGKRGFDKVLWKAKLVRKDNGVGVKLSYLSPDGEENYPGNLRCLVGYLLTNKDALNIYYTATTDKATPVNLTHHSYFNLAGQGQGDIMDHILMIDADEFTPVDEALIPTGEMRSVDGTPMDFTEPTAIGARIDQNYQQLQYAGGYDHNWVLNKGANVTMLAARLYEPDSGRVMEVHTTEPGIQFYSGNFLDGTITGKSGKVYKHRYGLCLETQHFPDSPNKDNFPSTILRPRKRYNQVTVFKFSTK